MWFVLMVGCEWLMVALVYCGAADSHRLRRCSFSVEISYLGADDAVVSLQWAATMANLLHLVYLTTVTQLLSPITTWFPQLPWLNLQTIWSAPPLLTPHSTTESWNLTLPARGNWVVIKKKIFGLSLNWFKRNSPHMCLVMGDVSDSSLPCSCQGFPSFSNMPENWLLPTHAHHPGAKASSCGCCKANGRECEHGLCLALMANQVCLMSHCCDYQHSALVRLEAPQVKQRGEANICTAGGPQTTLMGFHLLLGQPEPSG